MSAKRSTAGSRVAGSRSRPAAAKATRGAAKPKPAKAKPEKAKPAKAKPEKAKLEKAKKPAAPPAAEASRPASRPAPAAGAKPAAKTKTKTEGPARGTPATTANKDDREGKMVQPSSEGTAPRKVVRIAAGLRQPKNAKPAAKEAGAKGRPGAAADVKKRAGGRRVEVNPRLERSGARAIEAPSEGAAAGTEKKVMSVAAKNRAKVEAMFAQLTKTETEGRPVDVALEASDVPFSARPAGQGAFERPRLNPFDSLTTKLRMASERTEILEAATELADSFKHLPPDQSLLLKVIQLGNPRLTKLAMEELLELDDRGRVRSTPELKQVIQGIAAKDVEIEELKQLFLQKIRA